MTPVDASDQETPIPNPLVCTTSSLQGALPFPKLSLTYNPKHPHTIHTVQRDYSDEMNNSASGDACLLLFNDHLVSISPDLTVCLCVTVPRAAPTGSVLLSGFPFTLPGQRL